MRVLVGCELSGVVRDAFNERGHYAVSCDLLPTEVPDLHYEGDVFAAIRDDEWDLIILHPPCTALCVAGNGTYSPGGVASQERKGAIRWTIRLWTAARAASKHTALENPVGVLSTAWRKPDQYIQPWEYGHPETKKTGLWLHSLPALKPTNIVYDEMMALPEKEKHRNHWMSPGPNRGKERSRTYAGIARAMAEQWG